MMEIYRRANRTRIPASGASAAGHREGTPPIAGVTSNGIWAVAGLARKPKRSARCARMAATESAAMTVVLRRQGRDRVCSISSTNSRRRLGSLQTQVAA